MDYKELAKQFLQNSYMFRKNVHQKKIDETLHGEMFAIQYIFFNGEKVLPSEISDEMHISTARVAAILNSIESKGLITRQIDVNDRRRILVSLTDAGRELAIANQQLAIEGATAMLKRLEPDEAKELVRLIGKMAHN